MGRLAWLAIPVAVLAVVLGLFGREVLPKMDERPKQYGSRLLAKGAITLEDLYVRALLLVPGTAHATVVPGGGAESAGAPAPAKPKGSAAQETLKQEVAKNEDEISAQQEVSARRYAEAQREATAEVVIPEQPDEVRQRMPAVDPQGPEMRCGEPLTPSSSVTTRDIELIAKSTFQGGNGKHFGWKYTIRFVNHGKETVQMLTRHWVFVDAKGQFENEVKGPGARGVTPVLPPGGEWGYESGTSLSTPFGSMHGSFQFEVLKGDKSPGRRSFSARVGRLLLSHDGQARKVPCPEIKDTELLPATSVLVTERVIIGAQGEFLKKAKNHYHFSYDVQINNAREAPVEVVGHFWELVDERGRRRVLAEDSGVGGVYGTRSRKLAAGDAFRTQGELVSPTRMANAQCTYRVIVQGEKGLPVEIEARTDWIGLAAERGEARVPNFVTTGGSL